MSFSLQIVKGTPDLLEVGSNDNTSMLLRCRDGETNISSLFATNEIENFINRDSHLRCKSGSHCGCRNDIDGQW